MARLSISKVLTAAALVAALAGGAVADVNKFQTTGLWADDGAAGSELLAIKGKFNTSKGKLTGRISCGPDCPLKGKLKTLCEVGDGFYFVCAGTAHRKKCQVSGTLYQQGFEGTYTCGERTGLWMFGNP